MNKGSDQEDGAAIYGAAARDAELDVSPHAAQLQRGFAALRFAPQLEEEYRQARWETGRRLTLFALLIAAVMLSAFAFRDYLIASPEVWWWTVAIRMGVMVPALLLAMLLIVRAPRRWAECGICFAAVLTLYGLMTAHFMSKSLGEPIPYEGLMLVIFFLTLFNGMRIRAAAGVCLPVVVVYCAVSVRLGDMPSEFGVKGFYLFAATLIGLFGLYLNERSERRAYLTEQLASFRAERDPLTLLHNRRALMNRLNLLWRMARRQKLTLAVFMIDVDQFKSYNDTAGHVAGDECLQQVAGALASVMHRPMDIVGRQGGEEFMALAYPITDEGARQIGEALRAAVEQLQMEHPAKPGTVLTVSVGICCASGAPPPAVTTMINCADDALYAALAAGRNRVEFADGCGTAADPAPA